ncbi:tetratricopeptide repeat protein [Candidatus Latescibacterota bacterium]
MPTSHLSKRGDIIQSPLKKSFAAEQLKLRKKKRTTTITITILVVAVIVAVIAVGYALYMHYSTKEILTETVVPTTEEIIEKKPSIAVLPFVNMSDDPEQEYFCDGMAEEIINALTNVGGLRVIARTSAFFFKGKDVKVQDVGKELNVETVLEGSVRKADNQLRITAQLINVADESHIWSDAYNRELEDVFAIQEEISLGIVEALKVKLLEKEKAAIEKRPTENPEAWALYLQGCHFWNLRASSQQEEMLRKGLDNFQKAVEKDSDFALAYTGIANSYHELGYYGYMSIEEAYRKGKEAVDKALDLDDTLAEVHVSLGLISQKIDNDFPAAGKEFKRAVELNPNSVIAQYYYAQHLEIMGRDNDALEEFKRAQELDPLDRSYYYRIALSYLYLDRYDEAIKECYKGIEIFPEIDGWLYYKFLELLISQRKYNEALEVVQLARENLEDSTWGERSLGNIYALSGERAKVEQILAKLQKEEYLVYIAYIYIDLGEKEKAENILQELIEQSKKGIINPDTIAHIYAYWGELDKAMDWFEKTYEEQPDRLVRPSIRFAELCNKNIRSHPRYIALQKKRWRE